MTLQEEAREWLVVTNRDPAKIRKALESIAAAQGKDHAEKLRAEMRRQFREVKS